MQFLMISALKNGPTFAQWGDFRSEKNILQYFEKARLFRLLLEWDRSMSKMWKKWSFGTEMRRAAFREITS